MMKASWFYRALNTAIAMVAWMGLCGCSTTTQGGGAAPVVAAPPPASEISTGFQPIQSAMIYSVNYDAAAKRLTVVLYEDGVYDYEGVPGEVYDGLLKSKDRDQYYRETIQSAYKGKKFTMD